MFEAFGYDAAEECSDSVADSVVESGEAPPVSTIGACATSLTGTASTSVALAGSSGSASSGPSPTSASTSPSDRLVQYLLAYRILTSIHMA